MSEITAKIQLYHIEVVKTARYASLGKLTNKTKYVWLVCHGYGQTASEFIADFSEIESETHYIVAPEGLSRFYWGAAFDGKPVASWMTKEDRLNEIKDYSNYLSKLYNHIRKLSTSQVEFILFGFSQGCATVMRWTNIKFPNCKAIINWGGTIPEDIEYNLDYYAGIELLWRYGTDDRFMSEERLQWHMNLIEGKKLTVNINSYDGKHKVYPEGLKQIIKDLDI